MCHVVRVVYTVLTRDLLGFTALAPLPNYGDSRNEYHSRNTPKDEGLLKRGGDNDNDNE